MRGDRQDQQKKLSDEQLVLAGIEPGMVRFSVGLENVDDIIEDIKALDISNMTPIDALNTLYKLQGRVKNRW